MYGELMQIETLVERVAELKEANRRLQTLNVELVEERDKLAKENEAYKDMFTRMRNLVEAVGE
jgi:FtsZ-binding cell division protein ZapB